MKAWYFSNTDCRLRFDDNRKIKAGVTHKVDCKPVLCESGLHGSINILHALRYIPGPYVWRVNLSGEVVRGSDKHVATERTYLWGYDATPVLRKFARLCALDVLHLWEAPDVVVKYLKTGNEDIRVAARDASINIATATVSLTKNPTRAAAEAAAWATIWDVGSAGTEHVVRYAYLASAVDDRAAIQNIQSKRLYRMIMEERPRVAVLRIKMRRR